MFYRSKWIELVRFTKLPLLLAVLALVMAATTIRAVPTVRSWWIHHRGVAEPSTVTATKPLRVTLAAEEMDALNVPKEVVENLGLRFTQVRTAPEIESLRLAGTLTLSADQMVHVNARFSGEVVEIGECDNSGTETGLVSVANQSLQGSTSPSPRRPLRFGDQVKRGQLLAVIWSKDLGEKKSELVEHLSRLHLNQTNLKRLESLLAKGSVSERGVREAEQSVEVELIAVSRAERTLRSWKIATEEIRAIRQEAEKIRDAQPNRESHNMVDTWARVEVRAPSNGTIVEKNITVGDQVASDLNIFTIADLQRIDVLAHAYEEELPDLERLPAEQRHWNVTLKSDPLAPPLKGSFDRIGTIIDPAQHTALVMGWVDNSDGRLRVGQFITAHINLPAPADEVAVPIGAIIDQEGKSFVFVRSASDTNRFVRRKVFPSHRRDGLVCISCERHSAARPDNDCVPLKSGEWVVAVGGVELAAELDSLKAAARTPATP